MPPTHSDHAHIKTFAVKRAIALIAVFDIANSFFMSFIPIPLALTALYTRGNEVWIWHYIVLALWATIAIGWGALLAAATFSVPRCSLEIGDAHGPDVATPIRCVIVTGLHCLAQYAIYCYFYG